MLGFWLKSGAEKRTAALSVCVASCSCSQLHCKFNIQDVSCDFFRSCISLCALVRSFRWMLHGVVTLVQLLLPELAGVLFLKALLSRISMMRHESYRNRDLTLRSLRDPF